MRFLLRLGVVLLALVALAFGAMAVRPARAAALEPQPHPTCTGFYYTVKPGDHLYRIALRYDTTMSAITYCNHLPDADTIYAGQKLLIPTGSGGPPPACNCSGQHCNCPPQPCSCPNTSCNCPAPTPTPMPTHTPAPTQTPPTNCNCASCGCPTQAPPVLACTCPGGTCPPAPPGLPATVTPVPTVCTCSGVAGAHCGCGYKPVPVPYDPSYTTYTVKHGDTLYSIAHHYGTTVSAIMVANGLTNPNHIYAGQTLRIPT